jgi:hypothetical protein
MDLRKRRISTFDPFLLFTSLQNSDLESVFLNGRCERGKCWLNPVDKI